MNDFHDPETYRIDGMHSGLGVRLMLSYFTRLECGICGPKPLPGRRFTDSVWIEAGYSIDAPESMPAGGCRLERMVMRVVPKRGKRCKRLRNK